MSVDGRPRRRCASSSRAQSEAPPERSPYVFGLGHARRTPSAKSRRNGGAGGSRKSAVGSAAAPRIANTPLVAASRRVKTDEKSRGRQREKSKPRDLFDDDMSTLTSLDESWDAESSVRGRGNAKRRRLSPRPSLSVDTSSSVYGGEDDSQRTAVEEDFEMLEGPESLPWVPMNPDSKDSEYVPPGLNALIDGAFPLLPVIAPSGVDIRAQQFVLTCPKPCVHHLDMKRALVLQISARQKAENLHAEELQRRLELEREAARLAAANRALEGERLARATVAAPESSSNTLKNALVSAPSRRLTGKAPAVASGQVPPPRSLTDLGTEGPSGYTADTEMTEAARDASADPQMQERAEENARSGDPSGTYAQSGTITMTA